MKLPQKLVIHSLLLGCILRFGIDSAFGQDTSCIISNISSFLEDLAGRPLSAPRPVHDLGTLAAQSPETFHSLMDRNYRIWQKDHPIDPTGFPLPVEFMSEIKSTLIKISSDLEEVKPDLRSIQLRRFISAYKAGYSSEKTTLTHAELAEKIRGEFDDSIAFVHDLLKRKSPPSYQDLINASIDYAHLMQYKTWKKSARRMVGYEITLEKNYRLDIRDVRSEPVRLLLGDFPFQSQNNVQLSNAEIERLAKMRSSFYVPTFNSPSARGFLGCTLHRLFPIALSDRFAVVDGIDATSWTILGHDFAHTRGQMAGAWRWNADLDNAPAWGDPFLARIDHISNLLSRHIAIERLYDYIHERSVSFTEASLKAKFEKPLEPNAENIKSVRTGLQIAAKQDSTLAAQIHHLTDEYLRQKIHEIDFEIRSLLK